MRSPSIFNLYFSHRQHSHDRYAEHGDTIQKEQLDYLLHAARNTEIGKRYGFSDIKSYSDFASRIPVIDYEGIKPYVDRMLRGENNLIWPSKMVCQIVRNNQRQKQIHSRKQRMLEKMPLSGWIRCRSNLFSELSSQ